MPRRGRSPSPRPAPRARAAAPAPPPKQPVPVAQSPPAMVASQPRQPGMLANIASTATGVAVGSVVGHSLMNAFSGGGSSEAAAAPAAAAPATTFQQQQQPQSQTSPCQFEFKQFLECTQTQSDISLCQGFNEVFRQCQVANGLSPQPY